MAQEPLKVKLMLKSGAPIVALELNRIHNEEQILDLESQKVQERFAGHVAEQLGDTEVGQARHQAVTSHLHKALQGSDKQSMH